NLGDPIIRILLIALAIKTLFLIRSFDWYETIGIVIAILMASVISTLSERGSEASFKRLQDEASKMYCKVYRDKRLKQVFVGEVVCRDVVLLQPGDKVPADGMVISGAVNVDESALNGESKEILKDVNKNQLFRGSIICLGECKMLVTAVGDHTTYGSIALELQEEQRDSPLKIRLKALATLISRFGYVGATLVSMSYLFNVIVIQNNFVWKNILIFINNWPLLLGHILHAITLAVTVIVVAVPEGLPMMITLVLSLNMKKLLKNKVLVRKLLGIETSGSLNILFTDKTGTLTNGKLQVKFFINGVGKEYHKINDVSKEKSLFEILKISLICNNAASIDNKYAIGSNATDRALLEYISAYSINALKIKKQNIVLFDSKNKVSVTKVTGHINTHLIKGAPDKILPYCKYFYNDKGEQKSILNIGYLKRKIQAMSSADSIRFLAVATSDKEIKQDLKLEQLTLVGLIGIKDEIRKEAPKTIELVEKAGVQVVMITGDSSDTANSIAKETGLLKGDALSLSSDDLNKYSDEQLKTILSKIRVISRALPQDKSRLVRISQELGLVVGMTGDGVNDAPALKKADVGFAMGSGTEVAKEASDIVILDDNFLSISKSILYGRTIFKSIRKFIIFQLTVNLCAVGLSIIGPFIGINAPITVIQMLWVNMVMDTLAALAFAGEPPLKEYMEEKPKKRDEPIINHYMKNQILITGIYSLMLCIFFLKTSYIRSIFRDGETDIYLMTAFFALFIFMNIFNSFNTRTHRLNLLSHIYKNKWFIAIMLFITLVQIYLIYYGGSLFRVTGLSLYEFWIVCLLAFTIIPVDWIRKLFLRFKNNKEGV
ncbi:MAG: calcium-translocating P-type ATPase, PMCA-type, partial [Bacilli bacterium]|nr:calcium-translocating P-type ATPase, PMCA-type [Bacilli bacterium]